MNPLNQTDIFTLALGLQEPWVVTNVEMLPSEKDPQKLEVHITVDYKGGSKFLCPVCTEENSVYDSKSRTWRHLNFFQHRCYIHARVPRVKCSSHGVKTIAVPWARAGSGFTLLLEAVLLTMLQQMPVSQVARQVGEHDTRLWRIIEYYVEHALALQDFKDVTAIGVDEYSHKGHNYISVFLAHPKRKGSKAKVLFVTEGKDKETVHRFLKTFTAKRGKPDLVEETSCDMSQGYRNALAEAFPNSLVTVDKFHVVRRLGDAVDTIRRREMRSKDAKKVKSLANTRYLWLKNQDNLSEGQKEQLELLLSSDNLDTVIAYTYRLKLQGIYEGCLDYDEAVEAFEALCLEMSNSKVREIRKAAQTLTNNAVEILNYFITKRTNAVLEGFNSMIGLIKRRARGFKNMNNFMNMIYLVCGELELPKATIM